MRRLLRSKTLVAILVIVAGSLVYFLIWVAYPHHQWREQVAATVAREEVARVIGDLKKRNEIEFIPYDIEHRPDLWQAFRHSENRIFDGVGIGPLLKPPFNQPSTGDAGIELARIPAMEFDPHACVTYGVVLKHLQSLGIVGMPMETAMFLSLRRQELLFEGDLYKLVVNQRVDIGLPEALVTWIKTLLFEKRVVDLQYGSIDGFGIIFEKISDDSMQYMTHILVMPSPFGRCIEGLPSLMMEYVQMKTNL